MMDLNSAKEALIKVYDQHRQDKLNFGNKNYHMGISVPYGVVRRLSLHFKKERRVYETK